MMLETPFPKYKWKLNSAEQDSAVSVIPELGNMMSALLQNRGINNPREANAFFRPKLDELHDPFLLKDMEIAVNRLVEALTGHHKVMIYGDYDVDGTTAVSMTYSFLNQLGFDVHPYTPDRYLEGYGVSDLGITKAIEEQFHLIIALDCGIRDLQTIGKASAAGIDVIVCDHHEPGEELPQALAVLNPKRKDCDYPFDGLSGCGVGFKLLHAFCLQNNIDEKLIFSCLDLLTLSIAADIVPMLDENRILAYYGLQEMEQGCRPGIDALFKVAKFDKPKIEISDLVFTLAPRINAAGRMKHADLAVKLLCSLNPEECYLLAMEIEDLNNSRRLDDKSITAKALELIGEENDADQPATVVHGTDWNKGVIGIVASRLIDEYYRPTIVLTGADGLLTGSARSIEGFNIQQGLEECSGVLEKFGGHAMAAGLTVKEANLPQFKKAFSEVVRREIGNCNPMPELNIDAELIIDEFSLLDLKCLRAMEPYGPGNLNPIFQCTRLSKPHSIRIIGQDKSHLSFKIKSSEGKEINCIGFGMADAKKQLESCQELAIAFSISINFWKGSSNLQFQIRDLKTL